MRLSKLLTSLCICVGALDSSASAQLYLISGGQSPKTPERFTLSLLQVESAGEIREESIFPKELGSWFTELSYDARKLVALSYGGDNQNDARMVVMDFDSAKIGKTCPVPHDPTGYVGIAEWLGDVHSIGLSLVFQSVAADPSMHKDLINAISVDPSVACGLTVVQPSDIKSIETNGQAGVAGLALNENVPFTLDPDGNIIKRFSGGNTVYLGYQVPAQMRVGPNPPGFSVMINNSRALVVVVGGAGSDKAYRLLAFRKSDKTWHLVPNPSDLYPWARSFENYLVTSEAHERSALYPESAGRAEWREKAGKNGPSITGKFLNSPLVYPGKLHLYNIDTGQVYTINTNQGDSEVLLIKNGSVYYRVSERLYSASITSNAIDNVKLLASNEAIRDAHWAFVKH